MLQNETKSPQCIFSAQEKHPQRDQAKELNALYPTLTPAPSSPCGPLVTLVGDTLSRAVKWIQRDCKRTTWRDGAPWQWGKTGMRTNCMENRRRHYQNQTANTAFRKQSGFWNPLGNLLVILRQGNKPGEPLLCSVILQTLAKAKGSITLEWRRHNTNVCPVHFHLNSLSVAELTQEGPTFITWTETYRRKGFLHLMAVASSNKFPVLRGARKRSKGCLSTLGLQWHAADLARHKPFGNTSKQHSFMTPRALGVGTALPCCLAVREHFYAQDKSCHGENEQIPTNPWF